MGPVLEPEGGYLRAWTDTLLHDPDDYFSAGDEIPAGDFHITIEALTEDRHPAPIRVDFGRPLDHEGLLLIYWEGLTLQPFEPPAIGERLVLPEVDLEGAAGLLKPSTPRGSWGGHRGRWPSSPPCPGVCNHFV